MKMHFSRLKEILCCVANANMFAITDEHGQQHLLSITDALQEAKLHETSPSGQADLSGYMVLTDSILHLIMDAPTENPVSQVTRSCSDIVYYFMVYGPEF